MNAFFSRLKFVKGKDLLTVFPMILGVILAQFLKIRHPHMWLVCERKTDARDNGYWFFKYMVQNHPEQETIYAISSESVDYPKVAKLGKVIEFGTLKHWMYYFAAEKNISSQKEGKPNAALCFLLEVYLNFRKNRVYLKHGIIKDDMKWIYYNVSKINLVCCAAKRECEYIREKFGYPNDYIQLVGLCRFDNLLTEHEVKKQILVLPTWREWLGRVSSDTKKYETAERMEDTEYFRTWIGFLQNDELHQTLKKAGYSLLFYPHPSMQQYLKLFDIGANDLITIASKDKYDIQQLLMESALLITDYSSIYFDFAYMKKPLLYYQFDYNKYREGQYQEGYYSYDTDAFGPVVANQDDVLEWLKKQLENDCIMETEYENKVDSFFAFRDKNNCERTYYAIKSMNN
ncbi:MAG: CDP-glycerol glycerophosphotransferase family protein [Eubacteriales bacterium]|nr:CDP-glycerol glycerophosphotransferase family protein [Eubacteriales bacterium]